jgi:ubiquinone/menaquinone biosynthesis C-methylase UbiE
MTDYFADRAAQWDKPGKIEMADNFVQALLKHIEPQPGWKALEIGAGTGLVGLQLLPRLRSIVFEDTSEEMLKVLRSKIDDNAPVEILHGEISEYRSPDIDFVFSNMAFHHIEDIPKTLEHLFSITTPGAKIAIGDIRSEDGSFHRFDPIPHKGFDTDELSAQFEKAGFRVLHVETYNVLRQEKIPGKLSDYEQFILIAEKPKGKYK